MRLDFYLAYAKDRMKHWYPSNTLRIAIHFNNANLLHSVKFIFNVSLEVNMLPSLKKTL